MSSHDPRRWSSSQVFLATFAAFALAANLTLCWWAATPAVRALVAFGIVSAVVVLLAVVLGILR